MGKSLQIVDAIEEDEAAKKNALQQFEIAERLDAEEDLYEFVRLFWSVVEPSRKLVRGKTIRAICDHLMAVTEGKCTRLLMNVPPGCMKSLLVNVFWPAWEWGPKNLASLRYVCASYSEKLTVRDNGRFLAVITSPKYQAYWGNRFRLKQESKLKIENDKTGWKQATSVGGLGTGERGDRFIIDDPHNVKDAESEVVRETTLLWFQETVPNRLNDQEKSAIVVIMQRVHSDDVSGDILSRKLPYLHLCLPMEYDPARHCITNIGFSDWRTEDGELLWPKRFPKPVLDELKRTMGSFATACQYQQLPAPRGGGIIKDEHWKLWGNPEDSDDPKYKEYPTTYFRLVSADTAYTTKQENDWSAVGVWGCWRNDEGLARVMLMHAWRARLPLHELVTRLGSTCKTWKADRLLIEAKASGISVAQEIQRLYANELWATELVDPRGQDKVARAYSVQHIFEEGMIYAPDREWAEKLIEEVSVFPKGSHDDQVDQTTMAIKWLRDNGLLQRGEERQHELEEKLAPSGPPVALYDV